MDMDDLDNLSEVFNNNAQGVKKSKANIKDNIIKKNKANNNVNIFDRKVSGLDSSKLNNIFLKNKNKLKGGFNKMLGENIKSKKSVVENTKDKLKGSGFYSMLSSVGSSKGNSINKVNYFFGNIKNKNNNINNMLGGSSKKINNMLGIKNKTDFNISSVFRVSDNGINKKLSQGFNVKDVVQKKGLNKKTNNFNIGNAFGMNNNMNINKKLRQAFNVKSIVQGSDLNRKISMMIGNPKGLEQKGWYRAHQQIGLSPLGDFDGDKVINMLDCNPRNPYEQGAMDTIKKWGRILTGKDVKTDAGQLQIYEEPIESVQQLQSYGESVESKVIDVDPTKAGKAIWKGVKKVGVATGEGLKNIAIGSGFYKTSEQRKVEARYKHQEELAKIKEGTLDDIQVPLPRLTPTQIVKQKGLSFVDKIQLGAGRMHTNISEAVRLGSPGWSQSISQIIGMGGTPGMLSYLAATGTRPLSEKMELVSLGQEIPFSEKAKLISGQPIVSSYTYKVQEVMGGIKPEDVELAEKIQKEKLEQLKVQEELEKQKVLRERQQVLRAPLVVPQQIISQPIIPGTIQQPQIRQPFQPLSYQQQHYAAQVSPVMDIYSPYSKRKVGYTRGKYQKRPRPGIPQIIYQPVQ